MNLEELEQLRCLLLTLMSGFLIRNEIAAKHLPSKQYLFYQLFGIIDKETDSLTRY